MHLFCPSTSSHPPQTLKGESDHHASPVNLSLLTLHMGRFSRFIFCCYCLGISTLYTKHYIHPCICLTLGHSDFLVFTHVVSSTPNALIVPPLLLSNIALLAQRTSPTSGSYPWYHISQSVLSPAHTHINTGTHTHSHTYTHRHNHPALLTYLLVVLTSSILLQPLYRYLSLRLQWSFITCLYYFSLPPHCELLKGRNNLTFMLNVVFPGILVQGLLKSKLSKHSVNYFKWMYKSTKSHSIREDKQGWQHLHDDLTQY